MTYSKLYANAMKDTTTLKLDGLTPQVAIVARGLFRVDVHVQPGGTHIWHITGTGQRPSYKQGYATTRSKAQGALNRLLSAYNTRVVLK